MKDHGFDLAFNNTEIDHRLPDLLAGITRFFILWKEQTWMLTLLNG